MYLKEVAGKVIGSFRVGTGHFVQGTLLTHSVESVDFADVVSTPRPYDQEIRRWKSVLVDGSPVHVVLDGLDRLARMQCAQEGRRVRISRFTVFVLRRSRILYSSTEIPKLYKKNQ